MARDPVCGMDVDPTRAAAHMAYDWTTYYFCSTACYDTFHANPAAYASTVQAVHPPVASTPGTGVAHVEIPVAGMTCTHCAQRMTQTLLEMAGCGTRL